MINLLIVFIVSIITIISSIIGADIEKHCEISSTNQKIFTWTLVLASILGGFSLIFLGQNLYLQSQNRLPSNKNKQYSYALGNIACLVLIVTGINGWNALMQCLDKESTQKAVSYLIYYVCVTFAGIIGLIVSIILNSYCSDNSVRNRVSNQLESIKGQLQAKDTEITKLQYDKTNAIAELKLAQKQKINAEKRPLQQDNIGLKIKNRDLEAKISEIKQTCKNNKTQEVEIDKIRGLRPLNSARDRDNVERIARGGSMRFKFKKRNSKNKPKSKKTKRRSKRR